MYREKSKVRIISVYCLFFFLIIVLCSCEGVYTIQGKVIAINGEPLPGVSVSSPEIYKHVITNARGVFTLRLTRQINKLEFMKSDYLPVIVPVPFGNTKTVTLPDIVLIPKPISPGVYLLNKDKNQYMPLNRGKIERTEISKGNHVPSIKASDVIQIKEDTISIYVFRLPQYDITLYRMKEYVSESVDSKTETKGDKSSKKTEDKDTIVQKEKKVWIPDEPVLVHTEFLSELDTNLFVLRPVNQLRPGMYCVNWRAFESPFPRMVDCFLFSIQENIDTEKPEQDNTLSEEQKKDK